MLERVPLSGHTVIADKGFAGGEFERWMAGRGATFLRPDRRDEKPRFGSLGRVRQWIESVFGPARASSASSATAPAPCPGSAPGSGCAYSPSPPGSGTTPRSASPGGPSPPTPPDLESTI
jgi:hypothetical protein